MSLAICRIVVDVCASHALFGGLSSFVLFVANASKTNAINACSDIFCFCPNLLRYQYHQQLFCVGVTGEKEVLSGILEGQMP
jgi:hypothetical protein